MKSGLDTRLARLENATAAGRQIFVWEPDVDYSLAELRLRHGAAPQD
jgi:hypothetical protein